MFIKQQINFKKVSLIFVKKIQHIFIIGWFKYNSWYFGGSFIYIYIIYINIWPVAAL